MDEIVELRKIPLEGFIEVLQDLYDRGADYVDIVAKPNEEQDIINLVVKQEYVDPEFNGFEEDILTYPKEVPMSDKDLDALV